MDDMKMLRKALNRHQRVSDGTVVRFSRTHANNGVVYNYVAVYIKATNLWYTTGRTREMATLTYDRMMEELANASSAEMVTGWEMV